MADKRRALPVDMSTRVGDVVLRSAVMTASGTAGHSDELAAYGDLSSLGAVVVKSLSVMPWAGNPAPRVHPVDQGMLNAVGLQGPGIDAWLRDDLPRADTEFSLTTLMRRGTWCPPWHRNCRCRCGPS